MLRANLIEVSRLSIECLCVWQQGQKRFSLKICPFRPPFSRFIFSVVIPSLLTHPAPRDKRRVTHPRIHAPIAVKLHPGKYAWSDLAPCPTNRERKNPEGRRRKIDSPLYWEDIWGESLFGYSNTNTRNLCKWGRSCIIVKYLLTTKFK